jgi:hypothetical protein
MVMREYARVYATLHHRDARFEVYKTDARIHATLHHQDVRIEVLRTDSGRL